MSLSFFSLKNLLFQDLITPTSPFFSKYPSRLGRSDELNVPCGIALCRKDIFTGTDSGSSAPLGDASEFVPIRLSVLGGLGGTLAGGFSSLTSGGSTCCFGFTKDPISIRHNGPPLSSLPEDGKMLTAPGGNFFF